MSTTQQIYEIRTNGAWTYVEGVTTDDGWFEQEIPTEDLTRELLDMGFSAHEIEDAIARWCS